MTTAPTDFYSELTARNTGFISPRAQGRVREATVLVAGCGSTGGAAVEPLARVERKRLPHGVVLEQRTQPEQLVHVTLGQLGHPRAATRQVLDQTLVGQ